MVVLDCLRRYKAPHNPHDVIAQMVATLRAYGLDRATGDAYAAEFTKTTFEAHGVQYQRCTTSAWKEGQPYGWKPVAKPKAVLYAELLRASRAARSSSSTTTCS